MHGEVLLIRMLEISRLKVRTDRAITWQQAEMTVTRSINPFGKCCKAKIVFNDTS